MTQEIQGGMKMEQMAQLKKKGGNAKVEKKVAKNK